MKRSHSLTLLTACFCTFVAAAQPNSTVPKSIRAANTLDNLFDANGLAPFDNLYGIPMEPGAVVGNTYLNPEWKRTTFLLYDRDKMVEGYFSRYEIDRDQFEVKTIAGIRALSAKRVKSFVWVDSLARTPHYFVNGREFKNESGVPFLGFFEVLTEGDLTLLAKTQVVVRKPTYNEKLDMGNLDTRILKKFDFYYLHDGILRELPSNKKKLLPVFGTHGAAIDKFIRVNSLSLDQPRHMRAVFEHYNGLAVMN